MFNKKLKNNNYLKSDTVINVTLNVMDNNHRNIAKHNTMKEYMYKCRLGNLKHSAIISDFINSKNKSHSLFNVRQFTPKRRSYIAYIHRKATKRDQERVIPVQ